MSRGRKGDGLKLAVGLIAGALLGMIFSFKESISLELIVVLITTLILLTLIRLWFTVPGKSTRNRRPLAPIKQPYSQNLLPFIQYAPRESFTDSLKSTLLPEFREPKATTSQEAKQEKNYQIKWITPQEVQELSELSELEEINKIVSRPAVEKKEEPKKRTWINVTEPKKGKVKFKEEEVDDSADDEDREDAYDPDKEAEKYILNSKKKFLQDLADSSDDDEDDKDEDKSDNGDLFF